MSNDAAFVYGADARKTYVSFSTVVLLPVGIGFAAGIYTGFIAIAFLLSMGLSLRYAAIPASIAAAFAWFAALRWVHAMVRDLEQALWTIAHGKLESDQLIRVETYSDSGRTVQRGKLEANYAQIVQVGKRVLSGTSISQGNMLDIFHNNRQAFQLFQASMVKEGWASWRNEEYPQQGVKVTDLGRAEFQRLIDEGIPPPTRDYQPGRVGDLSIARVHARAREDGFTYFDE